MYLSLSALYLRKLSGLIRHAAGKERISNRWNKHSSLTQSLQQLKRDIEILSLFL
ncbi:hypothetical protein ACP4OV_005099 [Aristida adscensionis]